MAIEPQVFDLLVHLIQPPRPCGQQGRPFGVDLAGACHFRLGIVQPDQRGPERNRRYRRTARADQDAAAQGPAVCRRRSRGGVQCLLRPVRTSLRSELPTSHRSRSLPFLNLSVDPEQDYFIDGIVEDIITALSRNRAFFVIARNSSFTYKGKPVDIKAGRSRARRPLRVGRQRAQVGQPRARDRAIHRSRGGPPFVGGSV